MRVSLVSFFFGEDTFLGDCTLLGEQPFGEAHFFRTPRLLFTVHRNEKRKVKGETCMLTTAEEIGVCWYNRS